VSVIEIASVAPQGLRESLKGVSADVVFNLASAGVNPADREPLAMLDGNVHLLAGLLCSLDSQKTRRFIHTGSCSEYASVETGHRLTEDDSVGPSSLYGAAKLCASMYGRALAAERGICFLNLRLFGVFGAGEAPYRLVPYLIGKLREDEPVDLTAGEQIRDWLYVDDAVSALLAAATSEILGEPGVYNVCSGQATRVREVAEEVAETMKKPKQLLRFGARAYRPDESMWIVGDSRRFTAATGWLPRVSMAEGIRRMVVHPA
jgi:nucleoside-diphosphate-sugar epimerase